MKIYVLFFGAAAEVVNARNTELELTACLTTNAVLKNLTQQFPLLADHKLHISINQQYANGDEIVRDGDEIAIFTAVSGG